MFPMVLRTEEGTPLGDKEIGLAAQVFLHSLRDKGEELHKDPRYWSSTLRVNVMKDMLQMQQSCTEEGRLQQTTGKTWRERMH